MHKTLRILSALLLMAAMTVCPVMAEDKDVVWGDVYCFSQTELVSDGCRGVMITDISGSANGTLLLGSRELHAGDVLLPYQLDQMTFLPREGATGETTISCISLTDTGILPEAVTTLKIGSGKNEPPVAEDTEFETYRDIPGTIRLKASDPEGDDLTVNITSEPKRGTVSVDENGEVTYTPKEKKVGKDSFTYTVTDTAGNTSEEATVRIVIKKPTHKETYADLVNDPALLSATWLREEGIYEGETISGQLLFQPQRELTRGEFIAMCVGMTGLQEDAEELTAEFSEDSSLPQWLQPYAASALKCGYISSVSGETPQMLDADSPITWGEASVIVSSVLSLPAGERSLLTEQQDVPTWCANAVAAMVEADLYAAASSSDPLTRAQGAQLLYEVRNLAKSSENTLLSWAKE
ncbi:MAG: Ig-like domain-containing protein [Oscillospiraceae bacterium]|nr:Ig-like domain-containing protein [Oscillospiraceae bacterium]